MGFLATLDEIAETNIERCCDILRHGAMRGAFFNKKLRGFCGYRPHRLTRTWHRAEIGPFFVTRHCQGTGVAQALMAGVIDEAKSEGIARLELFVDTDNLRAVSFYEAQGFERVATHYDTVRIDGQSRNDFSMTLQL
jgi:ribosomal protein S18 acetylase RimI-like enzyme